MGSAVSRLLAKTLRRRPLHSHHRTSTSSSRGGSAASHSTAPAIPKRLKKFSYSEVRLMKQYLPSFVYYEKSTEKHRQIAAQHWERVFNAAPPRKNSMTPTDTPSGANKEPKHLNKAQNSKITELYDVFYAYLEEHGGDLKHVFRSSMHVRGRVLVHISAGMRTMLASDNITDKIAALTKTHRRFGVKPEHYDCVERGLIHAMERTSGENWSPEIDDAWRRMFSHSSVILIRSQRKDERQNAKEFARLAKAKGRLSNGGVSTLVGAKPSGFSLSMGAKFSSAFSSRFSTAYSSTAEKTRSRAQGSEEVSFTPEVGTRLHSKLSRNSSPT
ncbi:hypothetical protein PHYSODRAFT_361745 [Phytophthora sojae]|uniref:Globin domain-containing protein n=1 Tax=Phytophthora sojae (strain P6497) TaxID=1094619 RepID=G4ZZ87_PHYSP|nr:hypothetical protein PHYSODRAFT_361745 [Phytophthora sojae]EGZ11109.1 hypothetical protein PHYSODRAFT_361745 [Phytophthora sojae]|eukprot:XP_009533854.1 hypothetical protein PHYSODRAFT_361745 [Phytophthora sojae]